MVKEPRNVLYCIGSQNCESSLELAFKETFETVAIQLYTSDVIKVKTTALVTLEIKSPRTEKRYYGLFFDSLADALAWLSEHQTDITIRS